MTNTLARQRQIVGPTADWAAHDLVLGDGELALERQDGGAVFARVGDGSTPFSAAPYLTTQVAAVRYIGNADPTQPPPAGASPGDAYTASPGGVVDASWGPPAAGMTVDEGDFLVMGADGSWNVQSGGIDASAFVTESELGDPAGAGMTGFSHAVTYPSGSLGAHSHTRASVTDAPFNAVGDGVADDTAAIQAALDLVGSIYLGSSARAYKISGTLHPPSGSRIFASGATIRQTVDHTSIFDVVGRTNIEIEGVAFVDTASGHVTNDANPHAAVFGGAGTANVAVRFCRFSGITYAGARFASSSNVSIIGCTFIGPGPSVIPALSNLRCYSVVMDAGVVGYDISGNDISATLHGPRIEQAKDGRIVRNNIHDIAGQHGAYIGAGVENLTFSSNTIVRVPLQGIKVQAQNTYSDTRNIAIIGNTVRGCGDSGITLSNGAGLVAGHEPGDPTIEPTYQPTKCRTITVMGNLVDDCVGSGIVVQNTVGGMIDGNNIANCQFSGIAYGACDFLTIARNQIITTNLSGIRDNGVSADVNIHENVLHNVGASGGADGNGIFIQNLLRHSIRRNQITNGSGSMVYGMYLLGDCASTVLADNEVSGALSYGLRCAGGAVPGFLQYSNNLFAGALGAAANSPALYAVASAAALVLPTQCDVVLITGTTGITSIDPSGHTGHRISLKFADIVTVTRGSNVYVATTFTSTINDVLTLVCDGSLWLEEGRSVN